MSKSQHKGQEQWGQDGNKEGQTDKSRPNVGAKRVSETRYKTLAFRIRVLVLQRQRRRSRQNSRPK